MPFRLKGKLLALTYPQVKGTRDDLLAFLQKKMADNLVHYYIVQELHEDGNPHLHAYVEVKKAVDYSNSKCLDFLENHGNYQTVKNKLHWLNYVFKTDEPEKRDLSPLSSFDIQKELQSISSHIKRDSKKANLELLETAMKEGGPAALLEGGEISLYNYKKLKSNLLEYKSDLRKKEIEAFYKDPSLMNHEKKNFWYYGPSRVGKTTFARRTYYPFYLKSHNKFWGDYEGQKTVILEDLGLFGKEFMGDFLKNWADKWPFQADVKHSQTEILLDRFIVTSNYHPSQIWQDHEILEPLYNRFNIIFVYKEDTDLNSRLSCDSILKL